MSIYIGTKVIKATLMTLGDYNDARGWSIPANEDPMALGYMVAYPDSEGNFGVALMDNYVSWSPQDVFDASYHKNGEFTFGEAVLLAKAGKRVARKGWNGAGMFAYIVPAATYPAQTGAAKAHFGDEGMVPYREYWALKTAQGDVSTWAPSGSDSLAEDWVEVTD